jgi:hypothetical protein
MYQFFQNHPVLADKIHTFAVEHPDATLVLTGLTAGVIGGLATSLYDQVVAKR